MPRKGKQQKKKIVQEKEKKQNGSQLNFMHSKFDLVEQKAELDNQDQIDNKIMMVKKKIKKQDININTNSNNKNNKKDNNNKNNEQLHEQRYAKVKEICQKPELQLNEAIQPVTEKEQNIQIENLPGKELKNGNNNKKKRQKQAKEEVNELDLQASQEELYNSNVGKRQRKSQKCAKKVKKDNAGGNIKKYIKNKSNKDDEIDILEDNELNENAQIKKIKKSENKAKKQRNRQKKWEEEKKYKISEEESKGSGKQGRPRQNSNFASLFQLRPPLNAEQLQLLENGQLNFFQPQSRSRIQEQLQKSNQQINQLIAQLPQFFENQPSYQNYFNQYQIDMPGCFPYQSHGMKNVEQNQQYYIKSEKSTNMITTYDQNEPYMKIIVQKANCNDVQNDEHILTQNGLVGSEKNTICEDVVIGRQLSLLNATHPNDIVLPANDRAISRIHCKINYKDGFKNMIGFKTKTKIIDQFIAFLMSSHYRLGANSPFHKLPKHIYALIWKFHKAPRKFYIADIGSIFGTFIKIKPNYIYLLERGQNYLIGADIQFWISDSSKTMPPLNSEQIENEEFLKYLAYQQKFSSAKLHGLPLQCENKINVYLEQITQEQQNNYLLQQPMLTVELSQAPTTNHSRHLFIANQENQEFKIGRAQNCDILINHNTISRKQCRFNYQLVLLFSKNKIYQIIHKRIQFVI